MVGNKGILFRQGLLGLLVLAGLSYTSLGQLFCVGLLFVFSVHLGADYPGKFSRYQWQSTGKCVKMEKTSQCLGSESAHSPLPHSFGQSKTILGEKLDCPHSIS